MLTHLLISSSSIDYSFFKKKLKKLVTISYSGLTFSHIKIYAYEMSITLTLLTVHQRKDFYSAIHEKNRYFQLTIAFNRYHSSYSASYRPNYVTPSKLVSTEVRTEKRSDSDNISYQREYRRRCPLRDHLVPISFPLLCLSV